MRLMTIVWVAVGIAVGVAGYWGYQHFFGAQQVAQSAPPAMVAQAPDAVSPAKAEPAKEQPKTEAKASAPAATSSSAWLPMAKRGEITSPQILAERIRESLAKDATGNGVVRGANMSPNGFLAAIRKAGGTVDGVGSLPTYIGSLVVGDMPAGSIPMSRVQHARAANGAETFLLDISQGYSRSARAGEKGWYDPNTNLLIVAGDCSNSPLKLTKGPEAPRPRPAVAQAPQYVAPPAAAPAPPPPAPQVQAPAPKEPAYVPPVVEGGICPSGKFSVAMFVWGPEALSTTITVKNREGEARQITAGEAIDIMKRNGRASDPFASGRISRDFGGRFFQRAKEGSLGRAEQKFPLAFVQVKQDRSTVNLWSGYTSPGEIVDVPIPNFEEGDVVKAVFGSEGLASPLNREIHAAKREWRGCKAAMHAVKAPGV